MGCHDVTPIRPGGDLHRSARTGQADLRLIVISDDGGIDITEAVYLGAAHEANVDVAALQIQGEDIVHAAHRESTADQGRVTDRQRQAGGLGTDHACLIDHHQIRGVCTPGEVAG